MDDIGKIAEQAIVLSTTAEAIGVAALSYCPDFSLEEVAIFLKGSCRDIKDDVVFHLRCVREFGFGGVFRNDTSNYDGNLKQAYLR